MAREDRGALESVNITISIPDELQKKCKEYKWINWSEVCRMAIRNKLEWLEDVGGEVRR